MWVWVILATLSLCACARRAPSSDALYREGETLLRQGKLTEALKDADAGLRRDQSWRFRLLRAEILLNMGDGQKARETLRPASPPTGAEELARVAMHEGYADFLLSDYDGAQAALERARVLAGPLKLPLLDAQIQMRQGVLLIQRGRMDEAEADFRAAIRTAAELHDSYLQASATGNLAYLFLKTSRYEEAIYWLSQTRDMFERTGSATAVAKALGNMGAAYDELGDYDQALACLREAERRFQESGNRREQQIWLGNIGNVLLDRGDYADAIPTYRGALEIARSLNDRYWTGWWLYNLAIASIHVGDFDAAERYNDEALRLKQDLRDGSDLFPRVNQAHIAAGRGDLGRAETFYRSIIAAKSRDLTPRLQALTGLAKILVQKRDFAGAEAQFAAAVGSVEQASEGLTRDEYKLSDLSSLIEAYQNYVDFLVARGQDIKALEVAESSRARVLDERLHTDGRKRRRVDIRALQEASRASGTVFLSYWLAPERSFLWAITASGVALHVLPGEKQITLLVDAYGRFIEDLRDPLESEFPAGRKLSEILLGPVAPLLRGHARVVVVADGALNSLNLETLPDPEDAHHYVIDRATVSVAPSLGLVTPARGSAGVEKSILLIGDPDPAVEEYPRLPYAAKEMALIEANFAPDRRVVLQGAKAYPAAYRDSHPERFRWIHFAAHAAANRESPLDSSLILSRHDAAYALSAREVTGIPITADLVTLSACRSAGARMYSGEGLVGLSWAFLSAGAKSVVAGLWDVTDMSTAMLISDFYARLAKDVAPAEALRRAKLTLAGSKGSYRKPFYWGPFQLYSGIDLDPAGR